MIDFDDLIDKHIFRERRPKEIGRYYPSEVGQCMRRVWYTYKHPVEIEPERRKVFELGDMLHRFMVQVLRSDRTPEVELLKWEFPVKLETKDFIVSGRPDDLIVIKREGKNALVEVKSCKSIRYVKLHPHHTMQLQFYMHTTGVREGIVLYIDKSTLQTKPFKINYSKNIAKMIMKKFRALHAHLTQDKLPIAEAKWKKHMRWMCRFCDYRTKCGKNEK